MGIVFLITGWSCIIGLAVYCFSRVLYIESKKSNTDGQGIK